MKPCRRLGLLAALLGTWTLGAAQDPPASPGRPNIVLLMADDIGYEGLSCYGSADYATPRLDALAGKGLRFTHCYAQPLCTPSRVQIMTGRYNHRNYRGFGYLDPKERTFANLLKEAGYATCIAGKWQLGGNADTIRAFGFDEHCVWNMEAYSEVAKKGAVPLPANYRNRYAAPVLYVNGEWRKGSREEYGPQVAADFIADFIRRHKDGPFLCYYPMILVHDPFVPTPDSTGGMTPKGKGRAKGGGKANFADMVAYMDKIVGQLIDLLEAEGLLENTLFLFTGDNGTHKTITSKMKDGRSIQGGKSLMTDAGTRVPFVAYWKGVTPAGVVKEDLVDFSDFLPTIAEAAGVRVPDTPGIDGVSLLPVLRGKPDPVREWVFCHYWGQGRHEDKAREFARDQRWKLYDNGALYDIGKDPGERRPVKDPSPEAEAARRKLQAALDSLHE
jgi:arylsulfatase A